MAVHPPSLVYGRTSGDVNVPLKVDADGVLATSATLGDISISGADGAITDGVTPTIKATVKDYTNAKPLTVISVDTNGDPASFSGGDASAANQLLSLVELEELSAQSLDYDTGAGTEAQVLFGLALPGAGGPVAGGTATNPIRVDPTGTTAQPITDNGGSITVDGPITDTQLRATDVKITLDSEAVVLGAGTAEIGKLAAGVAEIGNVKNSGTFAVQAAEADGANVTLGAKADAKSTATDTTAVSAMSVLKQISASVQAPPSQAVTNAGTFVTQVDGAALTALQLIDDPVVVLGTAVYTEAASKGFIVGAVRRDADTTLVDTTNEFGPLQMDAAGKLKVEVFDGGDSHTVDNNGTFVTQENGAALTSLQLLDDTVYTDDTSTHATGTSKGQLFMAAATPTDGSVNANDIGALAMTVDRKLHVAVMDALPAGTAAIGKLAANAGVTIGAVEIAAAQTLATLTTLTTLTGGGIAHDIADSGNPHKIGYIAYSPDGTTPGTAVAELDRTNAKGDLDGRLYTNPDHATSKHVHLDGSTAYTDQALIADPGDGFQVVITNIIGSTGAATALNFFLEEGATKIFGPIYLEAIAGRGFASGPIHLPCTASTAITLTSSASIAQSFDVDYFVQAV